MVSIDLEELLQYAKRVEGKTVVLTGGANGIGRETAILFARYGAKVVIGDVNGEAASKVVKEIRELGGNAIYVQCNVLQWEDQIALFESAVSHFGSVDVVVRAWFYPQGPSRLTISSLQIPCAGVSEHGDTCSGVLDYKDGKPLPPDMSTLEINLFGAVHTIHLGLNYLRSTRTGADQWKALILIGSMASWEAIPLTPMYTSSKFAIRGLMRSLYPLVEHDNIRIACVDPVWADTPILSLTARLVLTGSELLPATRIAQTVLYAATDPDPATSGCSWLLPDNGPIMRLERENIREGTYGVINDRIARFKTIARDSKLASRRIGGNLGKVMVFAGLTGVTLVWLRFGALA
ncbi:NAD(P)-binding protein [Mycena leptocephala]|nr:NAD(P)-binding protein [Mycena leptocephala]